MDIIDLSKKSIPGIAAELDKKGIMISNTYKDMVSDQHARSFTIAGMINAAMLQDVKNEISLAIKNGTSIDDFKDKYMDALLKNGWTGITKDEERLARPYRIEMILRQNMDNAYNAGRYKQLMEVKDQFPFWEYETKRDNRVRPAHKLLDGIIKPYNDDFWDIYYPPNGFLCRCNVNPLKYDPKYTKSDVVYDRVTKQYTRNGAILATDEGFETNQSKTLTFNSSNYDYDIAASAKDYMKTILGIQW